MDLWQYFNIIWAIGLLSDKISIAEDKHCGGAPRYECVNWYLSTPNQPGFYFILDIKIVLYKKDQNRLNYFINIILQFMDYYFS